MVIDGMSTFYVSVQRRDEDESPLGEWNLIIVVIPQRCLRTYLDQSEGLY